MKQLKELLKKVSPVSAVLAVLLVAALVYGFIHYQQMEADKALANGKPATDEDKAEDAPATNTLPAETTQLVQTNFGAGRALVVRR